MQGAAEAADEGVHGGGAAAAHATHHQVSQADIHPFHLTYDFSVAYRFPFPET